MKSKMICKSILSTKHQKGSTIQVLDKYNIKQTALYNPDNGYILIDPSLATQKPLYKSYWGIKVINRANWIGVGICHKKQVELK